MKKIIFIISMLSICVLSNAQDFEWIYFCDDKDNGHKISYGNDYSFSGNYIYVWLYEQCNNDCGVIKGYYVYGKSTYIRINTVKNTYSISIGHVYLPTGDQTNDYYDWDSNSYNFKKGSCIDLLVKKLK